MRLLLRHKLSLLCALRHSIVLSKQAVRKQSTLMPFHMQTHSFAHPCSHPAPLLPSGLTTAKELPQFRSANPSLVRKYDNTKVVQHPLPSEKSSKHSYGKPSAYRSADVCRNYGPTVSHLLDAQMASKLLLVLLCDHAHLLSASLTKRLLQKQKYSSFFSLLTDTTPLTFTGAPRQAPGARRVPRRLGETESAQGQHGCLRWTGHLHPSRAHTCCHRSHHRRAAVLEASPHGRGVEDEQVQEDPAQGEWCVVSDE